MVGRRGLIGAAMAWLVVCGAAAPLTAQTIFGTHSWQMQPYCNVVTLTLSPSPAGARLEGTDSLCGASNLGSAIGMATGNSAGNVTLNFTIVTAPAARPVHVTAVVNLQNGNGVWTDSGGNSGTMAYGVNTPGLPVRPVPLTQIGPNVITTLEIAPGAVSGSDINTAEVQARVSGSCPAGQAMSGINANGTVTCTAVTGGGGTPVAFKAGGHLGSGGYLPYAQYTDVTWTSTRFNTGGGTLSPAGTTYTVPAAGTYLLTGTVRVMGYQTSGSYCGGFRVNGTVIALTCNKYVANAQIDTDDVTLSTTAQLAAGDTVVASILSLIPGNGLTISGSNQAEANFTVTKLH